jgi:CBS domain-containing protein
VIKEEEQCELGIFTERDFLLKVLGENMDEALELPISEFMTSPAITVKESDVLGMAIAKMRIGGFRHILVEQEQSSDLLMLSIKDVVQLLLDQAA